MKHDDAWWNVYAKSDVTVNSEPDVWLPNGEDAAERKEVFENCCRNVTRMHTRGVHDGYGHDMAPGIFDEANVSHLKELHSSQADASPKS